MAIFINADSLENDEIEARVASGELKYCTMGPAGGRWLVAASAADDPNEIHAGLPGGLMRGVDTSAGPVKFQVGSGDAVRGGFPKIKGVKPEPFIGGGDEDE